MELLALNGPQRYKSFLFHFFTIFSQSSTETPLLDILRMNWGLDLFQRLR